MGTENIKAELSRIFDVLRTLEVQIDAGKRELDTLVQLHRDYGGIVSKYAADFVEYLSEPVTDLKVYRESVAKLDHHQAEFHTITANLIRRHSMNAGQETQKKNLQIKYALLAEQLEQTGAKLIAFKDRNG